MNLLEMLKNSKIGRFFRNLGAKNALPEGRGEQLGVIPERVEVAEKKSGHQQFAEELQEAAKKFEPENMPKEDAIMRILEEKGLSSEFAKNIAAKEQITGIVSDMLKQAGIERITSENLEKVKYLNRYRDEYGTYKEFEILSDGTFLLKEKNDEIRYNSGDSKNENSDKHFYMKDDMLLVDEKECITYRYTDRDKNEELRDTTYIKNGSEYNKDGIEMKKYTNSETFRTNFTTHESNKPLLDRAYSWEMQRNSDLVTAYVKSSDGIKRNSVGANVLLNTEHPEKLSTNVPISYEKMKETEKIYDNGFIEARSENDSPEKRARIEDQNNKLETLRNIVIQKSLGLRKLAEKNGLIQETTQEITD